MLLAIIVLHPLDFAEYGGTSCGAVVHESRDQGLLIFSQSLKVVLHIELEHAYLLSVEFHSCQWCDSSERPISGKR